VDEESGTGEEETSAAIGKSQTEKSVRGLLTTFVAILFSIIFHGLRLNFTFFRQQFITSLSGECYAAWTSCRYVLSS